MTSSEIRQMLDDLLPSLRDLERADLISQRIAERLHVHPGRVSVYSMTRRVIVDYEDFHVTWRIDDNLELTDIRITVYGVAEVF